jgi:tetratricopeptide (TPR) repeat protein
LKKLSFRYQIREKNSFHACRTNNENAKILDRMRLAPIILCAVLGAAAAPFCVGNAGADEPPATNAEDAEQRSRAHFKLGRYHLELHQYDEAIREFEIGYRYKPLPLFLYNIAQVAALAGQRDKALEYYERYLAANPKAPERAEVQKNLAQLRRALGNDAAPAPAPAAGGEEHPATSAAASPARTQSAEARVAQTSRAGEPTRRSGDVSPALIGIDATSPPPKPQPSHRKLWIALGVISAAALAGAAVGVGVSLSSSHTESGYNDWGTLTVTRR